MVTWKGVAMRNRERSSSLRERSAPDRHKWGLLSLRTGFHVVPRLLRCRLPVCAGVLAAVGLLLVSYPAVPLLAQQSVSPMSAALEERLGSGTTDRGLRFEEALRDFYRGRDYAPLWISMAGRESRLESLLIALRRSEEDGLYGADYAMERISRLLAVLELLPLIGRMDLELLLSDAYLAFASDLAFGRVDPQTLPGEWSNEREPFDAADALSLAVAKGGRERAGSPPARTSPISRSASRPRVSANHVRLGHGAGGGSARAGRRRLARGHAPQSLVAR